MAHRPIRPSDGFPTALMLHAPPPTRLCCAVRSSRLSGPFVVLGLKDAGGYDPSFLPSRSAPTWVDEPADKDDHREAKLHKGPH